MRQKRPIAGGALLLVFAMAMAAHGQDSEGFSWKMGPVDVNSGDTAKLIFANPFCSNPDLKIDATLAITDLAGSVVNIRVPGAAPVPARKRAIIACNGSIQLQVSGDQIFPGGTVVGVLQIIPDLSGIPWVPVNVPLASLQIGRGGRGDDASVFHPSIVIIPVEPVRRLILP